MGIFEEHTDTELCSTCEHEGDSYGICYTCCNNQYYSTTLENALKEMVKSKAAYLDAISEVLFMRNLLRDNRIEPDFVDNIDCKLAHREESVLKTREGWCACKPTET